MLAANVLVCAVLMYLMPFGVGLTCQYCSSLYGGEFQVQDCKNPINKTCGAQEDRCMKLELKVKMAFNDSKNQMAMNCTNSANCNEEEFCTQFNNTYGKFLVKECKVSCCEGDLCKMNTPAESMIPIAGVVDAGLSANTTSKHHPRTCSHCEAITPDPPKSKGPSSLVQSVSGLACLLVLVVKMMIY